MKKILSCIVFIVAFNYSAKAQEWIDINLIVSVNEAISPSSVSLKLGYKLKDGTSKSLDVRYIPGSLKIKHVDYDELMNNSIENLSVEIRNTEICNENISYSHFTIDDFKASWLKQDFFILRVYDTRLKKYKKVYDSVSGQNFTYEYDSPAGSMRRVQNVKTKKIDCP